MRASAPPPDDIARADEIWALRDAIRRRRAILPPVLQPDVVLLPTLRPQPAARSKENSETRRRTARRAIATARAAEQIPRQREQHANEEEQAHYAKLPGQGKIVARRCTCRAEYVCCVFLQLPLLFRDLIRMHIEMLRQFVQRPLALDCGQRHLRFERRRVRPSPSLRHLSGFLSSIIASSAPADPLVRLSEFTRPPPFSANRWLRVRAR